MQTRKCDVISQLSSESKVSSDSFCTVIRFLLKHLDIDTQTENLVEKPCCRFQTNVKYDSERQKRLYCDFAYCLAKLTYSVKCVKKLIQCFGADKVHMVIEDVYLSFNEIIEKALKRNKDKPHVKEEVEDILNLFSRVDNTLAGGRRNQYSV